MRLHLTDNALVGTPVRCFEINSPFDGETIVRGLLGGVLGGVDLLVAVSVCVPGGV